MVYREGPLLLSDDFTDVKIFFYKLAIMSQSILDRLNLSRNGFETRRTKESN